MSEKDVHTEHCCLKHGCKYGDDDCTVTTGQKAQSFECEYCDSDKETLASIPYEDLIEELERRYASFPQPNPIKQEKE